MKSIVRSALMGLCATAFVLLVLTNSLQAQGVVTGTGEIAGNVGFSNLTGVDGNKHVNFGASAGYNLSDKLTVLGEFSYMPMGSVNASVSGGSGSAHGNYQTYGGAARYNLGSSKSVVPYAVVGFGYARCSESANINVTGLGSGSASASINGDYVNFGGGASIYLKKGFGLRPEFRYEHQEFYNSGASAGQNVALGSVSVFYQFGGQGKKKKATNN
jgi:hypothetical protein